MSYQRIVISSGHGKYVRGASGILDEVDEARRVVDQLAVELEKSGVHVITFHDNESTTQGENLDRIVDYHNDRERDLDISVHFNAYEQVSGPMGVEVLYVTQGSLAASVSAAIASVGFKDRGAKKRTDLAFLNGTDEPAILIETCFVDSEADAEVYAMQFEAICKAIASALAGTDFVVMPPDDDEIFTVTGKVSNFGGPDDLGLSSDEGLAFIDDVMDAPQLFLPYQPDGTSGLARRLNPHVHFIACRWDYDKVPKSEMLDHVALVTAVESGISLTAFPADWGPHEDTGRVADISPGLMDDLQVTTDDEVQVIFPYKE